MPRRTPRLLALLLAATALSGCGMTSMMTELTGSPTKDVAVKEKAPTPKAVAADLEGNLRQAMLLRQAGSNDEAIHILSQLMLADADNPRVVAEYGKVLAQKGRAQDATQFLRRAIELTPNDWTLYSAMGVSFDQLGDQANARLAYERALALRPGEPSVLNNYALSRMLAKDPETARLLIAQAQVASAGKADSKIARNVELINGMAPRTEAEKPLADAVAAAKLPEPKIAAARSAAAAKLPEPQLVTPPVLVPQPRVAAAPPIAVTPMPQPAPPVQNPSSGPQNAGDVARLLAGQNPVANAAPRPLLPQMAAAVPQFEAQPISQAPAGVVMQNVPEDPYAGPVVTLKKPAPKAVARAEAPKPAAQKTAARADVVPTLRMAADKY